MTQRQSHQVLRIYATVRVPESWSALFTPTKAAVFGLYNTGSSLDNMEFLYSFDEPSVMLRRINAIPVPTTWESHPGLTLISDSAHAMSPFVGEGVYSSFIGVSVHNLIALRVRLGVNLAMQDVAACDHRCCEWK